MNQHVFFQEFSTGQQGKQPNKQPNKEQQKYLYNCKIIEISNNWEIIRELMYSYRNQTLNKTDVDKIDSEWVNFILQNNIDLVKYGNDNDKFIEDYIKK